MRYAEFWEAFLDRRHATEPHWTNATSPPPQNWFTLPTGASQITYNLAFTRDGLANTLLLEHPDPEINEARFAWLAARRAELDAAYAGSLQFDEKPGRKSSSIGSMRPGSIQDRERWDDHIDWMIDGQRRLRAALDHLGDIQAVAAATPPLSSSGDPV